jgi:hypothetical protein
MVAKVEVEKGQVASQAKTTKKKKKAYEDQGHQKNLACKKKAINRLSASKKNTKKTCPYRSPSAHNRSKWE